MSLRRWRGVAVAVLKVGVSAGLLATILGSLETDAVLTRLSPAVAWAALPALAVLQIQALGGALRWRAALTRLGHPLGLGACWRNVLLGLFVNQAMPSTIGGDVARVWNGWRLGLPAGFATRSLVTDRVFSFLGLIAVCLVGLPFLAGRASDPLVISGLLTLVLGGLGCLAVLLALRALPARVATRPGVREAVALSRTAWSVLGSRHSGPVVGALMVLPHLLDITVVWLYAHALGAPVDWLALALVVPPAILTSAVPVSIAGWGLREGALVVGFGVLGLPGDLALACSLLYGVSAVATGLIGGLIWGVGDADGLKGALLGARTPTPEPEPEAPRSS
ncbi:lysylphosphatidylglycerol synthase transmembrane domain-containing protein [Pararhodospirillum oryzae]|uniref:Flippase-like domain-containing protein n=1 Tax=Pararhodospirillum oryzae TaxID=478448 RepID=A0A512H420_9PROT|nr:lysylphosphatidylglycerol synthase transmembrane domain-containing protein [Pararhodospirillum oryzae]GEO80181.1 hypothetical protein ROR02_03120 [Pararhodospirillum oryzae]